jgi:hypothetical protein
VTSKVVIKILGLPYNKIEADEETGMPRAAELY